MSKPILIETHLENTTAQPIEINPFCPELGDWRKPIGASKWLFAQTRVHIKRVSEVTGRLTEFSSEYMVRDLEPFTLGPHDRKRFVFDLKTAGNIYAEGDLMAGPGEYKVWIEYWSATHSYDDDNSYEYEVKSNKITVNIADE